MDDMRELITVEQAEAAFRLLALLGPLVGLVIGGAIGVRRGLIVRRALIGLALGGLTALNYGLWRLYCLNTDRLGVDTVRNLVTNLVLFVMIGAVAGIAYGLLARRVSTTGMGSAGEGTDGLGGS